LSVKFSVLGDFSVQALKANKMRSFLTMLGIIIGVAAVILMMAIGQGAQDRVLAQINSLGSNMLMVLPGAAGQFVRGAEGSVNTMTLQDAQAVARLPYVAYAAPIVRGNGLATYKDQTWTTSIQGTTPDVVNISSLQMAQGRFFDQSDVQSVSPVAVIGQTVYQNLYPDGSNPVGTQIRINGVAFRVIGLLQTRGASSMGQDQDDIIYIPVTTAQIRLLGITNQTINAMQVQVQSKDEMDNVQTEITSLLRKRHRLAANQDNDFNIRNMAQIQSAAENVTGLMTIFLAGVAAISLVVGGIGVMNIMLVSVTERTREIGVRMAIGASKKDVLNQFLLEAVLLSLVGSFFGILTGVVGAKIFAFFTRWPTPVSLFSILLAVGFSIVIGVFFGYYPARRAANLNPAEALSYE